jgi:hypothetical protein
MKFIFSVLALLIFNSLSFAQLNMEWDSNFGGQEKDVAHSGIQTPDGGFIIVGATESEGSGKMDGYIIKVDSRGNLDWSQTYGGKKDDEFYAITKTGSNYAIAGYSASKGNGKKDFWLMIIDGEGNKVWEHFYGGDKDEEAYDIITTYDKNLVLAGYTKSKGAGGRDFWIIKVNPNGVGKEQGKILWKRNVGGGGTDLATKIKQSPVDSFIYVIGHSTSFGAGGMDLYFTRLSPDRGSARGKKYFGKSNFEHGNDFCFTDNNGYLLVGGTMSESKGYFDSWVLKIESEYYKEWEKTYGDLKDEEFVSVFVDGEDYVLGGFTASYGEGKSDAWIVKIDNKGNILRERTFGEEGNDKIHRMIQTADGGYLMIGETDSKGEGKEDMWIVKVK